MRSYGAGTWALLALRFVVEIVLVLAPVVIAVRIVGGGTGFVIGAVAAVLVALLWGVLLAPRRRVDAPIAARVAVELLLVAAVTWGLVAAGLATAALALVVAEVVALGGLWLLGLPPGTDAGA